jgi:hypothetical protein
MDMKNKIGHFVYLENFTLSRLFYYQAQRIVERAVLPTALVPCVLFKMFNKLILGYKSD